jgi:DNA-binding IclR family transcriptional regulator
VATTRTAERRRLTLGEAAAWLRRSVGPVAWSVLEAVAEHCEPDGERTVSYRSVRELAAELRLANDTVARALRKLGDAGLVRHESDRAVSGRFGSGRYVLSLPPNVFELATDPEHPSRPKSAAKAHPRSSSPEQLALLADG